MATRRKTKHRKQRVVMRSRRKTVATRHMRVFLIRGAVVACLGGVALLMATQSHSIFDGFLRRHTPTIELRASKDLGGLPLEQDLPARRFALWFPWVRWHEAARWRARYAAIQSVHFQADWLANRVLILVAPRTPIVRWNGNGFDGEGVVFTLPEGTWAALPKAHFSPTLGKLLLGRWLGLLSHQPKLWSQVTSVTDDGHGQLRFTTQTGAEILWGDPVLSDVVKKADLAVTVLDDAHVHVGGAASADLRFFEDGRIIVRPKSRVGQTL